MDHLKLNIYLEKIISAKKLNLIDLIRRLIQRCIFHYIQGLKDANTSENQSRTLSPPLMQAAVAAAVAAAANAGHQYPIRPMNVPSKLSNANCSRLMNASPLCSNPGPRTANSIPTDIAPSIQLSRNFVMDYMWQQQQQQHHSGTKKIKSYQILMSIFVKSKL